MPALSIGRWIAVVVFIISLVLLVLILAGVSVTQSALLVLALIAALGLAFLIG